MEAKSTDARNRPLFMTGCLFVRVFVFLSLGLYLLFCAGQVVFEADAGPFQITLWYALIFIGFVEIVAVNLYQGAEKLFQKYMPDGRSAVPVPPLGLYPWFLLVGLVANAGLSRFPPGGILLVSTVGFIVGVLIVFDVLSTGQGAGLNAEYESAERSF